MSEEEIQRVPIMSIQSLIVAVNHEHEQAMISGKDMVEHAVKCGEYLERVKVSIGHGEFTTWLEDNFNASISTSERYRRAFRRWEANPSGVTELDTIGAVLQLTENGEPEAKEYELEMPATSTEDASQLTGNDNLTDSPTEPLAKLDKPPVIPVKDLTEGQAKELLETGEYKSTAQTSAVEVPVIEKEIEEVEVVTPEIPSGEVSKTPTQLQLEDFAKDILDGARNNSDSSPVDSTAVSEDIKGFSSSDKKKWVSTLDHLKEINSLMSEVESGEINDYSSSIALNEASQNARKVSTSLQELSEVLAKPESKINIGAFNE
jgi:hypothetical protein